MSDLTLAIKLTTTGGQVVVKDIASINAAAKSAAVSLDGIGEAGSEAGQGLEQTAKSGKAGAQSLKQTGEAAVAAKRGLLQTSEGADALSRQAKQADADLNSLRGQMLSMVGIGAAFYGALAAGSGLVDFAYLADDFNTLQQRIKTATKETHDYNQVSAEMYAIAQRNGAELQSTVELFQRLSSSRKDLKATNDQMLQFTDAVQKLGVIGGSSNDAMANGLMQLSQGLSGGILRAEEFNSILENIPELAVRIGAGMDDIGKSSKELGLGDLRKMVLAGELLSKDVLNSILVQLPQIRAEFEQMPVSLGRASQMLDNSLSAAASKLDSNLALSRTLADVMAELSSTLDAFSTGQLDNLSPGIQAAIKTAELLAAVIGTVAVIAMGRYAVSVIASAQAQLLLNTASVKTTSALGMVTVATGTATVATNALAMAQRFLLGPLGLGLIAIGSVITAFELYKNAAATTAEENDKLAASFTRMSNAAKAETYQKYQQQLIDIAVKRAEAEKSLQDAMNKAPSGQFGGFGDLAGLSAKVAELKAKEAELNQAITTLNQSFADGLPALESYSSFTEQTGSQASTTADAMLKLYNAQMLSAQAADAQGRALAGVDLELFKAQFVEAKELPKEAEAAIREFAQTAKNAATALDLSKALTSLRTENSLLKIKNTEGDRAYQIAKTLSQYQGAPEKLLAALRQELQLQMSLNQLKEQQDYLKNIQQENDLLVVRIQKGEQEYQLQKAIRQLKADDPAFIAALEKEIIRQKELNEQLELQKYFKDGGFDAALDSLTQMGRIGGEVGNVLIDSFGDLANVLEHMTEQQDDFTKAFIKLSEERAKASKLDDPSKKEAALKKVSATEQDLMRKQTQAQLGSYASIAGAASKMFSENSKGREALHRMEMVFTAAEIALAIQKAAANALAAITNQGSGDPYTAFARIAAMAALMAGLGVFSGSASGSAPSAAQRQETQSTGTVLGDSNAKSESIANALGRIEDLELDQYAELRSINGSIRELSAGIENLAVNLVASYGRFNESNYPGELGKDYNLQLGSGLASMAGGGVIGLVADKLLGGLVGGLTNKLLGGLFGSTKKELVDSGLSFGAQELGDIISTGLMNATVYDVIKTTKKKLFGLSKSSSESTEYRAIDNALRSEFARIFAHMGESVTEAVSLLGLETNKTLESFVINLPALSFKDLKGDEIEKELQAMFSQQGDLMVQYLVPGIAEFQKMGEGLYDTLIRVAQEQAVFNAAMSNLGLQLSRFSGVTKAVELEVAQALIELMGGIEEFQSATSTYFSEFYNESEQLQAITKNLQAQFTSLGVAMPASRDGFKDLIDGMDLTTDAGQAMFAALMKLVPMMDEFYDAAERAAEEEKQRLQDKAALEKSFADQLAKMGMSGVQKSLFDLNAWFEEQKKAAEEVGADTVFLERLYGRKRQELFDQQLAAINSKAEQELSALKTKFESLFNSLKQLGDSLTGSMLEVRRQMAGWDESGYQQGQIAALKAGLGQGTIEEQMSQVSRLQSAVMARYNAEMAANNQLLQSQLQAIDTLKSNYQAFVSQMQAAKSALADSMLSIRRQMPGWNEVSFQRGNISSLRANVGKGSTTEQLTNLQQLQQAIMDRYNAELSQQQALQSAAESRYQADMAAYEAAQAAARQLLAAADALLLSDLSPAKMGEQFGEAQSQFNALLSKAKSGDADAMSQLSQVGNDYLSIARDYYSSGSSEYASIFNQVQAAYRSFAGTANGTDNSVPRPVLQFQAQSLELQTGTLAELEELQKLMDELAKKAEEEQKAELEKAEAALKAYQDKTVELQSGALDELKALKLVQEKLAEQAQAAYVAEQAKILAKQDEEIANLKALFGQSDATIGNKLDGIAAAILDLDLAPVIVIPPVVVTPPAATSDAPGGLQNSGAPVVRDGTNPIVDALDTLNQSQQQQTDTLRRELAEVRRELSRTQEMAMNARRLA